MELFQATHESNIENLYDSQRHEYREFVLKVYDELLEREVDVTESIESDTKPLQSKPVFNEDDIKHLKSKSTLDLNANKPTTSTFPTAKLESRQASRNSSSTGATTSKDIRAVDGSKDLLKAAVNRLSRSPSTEILSLHNDEMSIQTATINPIDV